ncbi:MAG: transcription antitermination factor NusB [Casimicrobiaceae bacterium]
MTERTPPPSPPPVSPRAPRPARPMRTGSDASRPQPRRLSREFVLQGLYEFLLAGHDPALIRAAAERDPGFRKCDAVLYRELWAGVHAERETLAAALAPFLDRPWPEVSPIERSILLLGAYELAHRLDIPWRVAINEAVELAKSYGGTDGYRWVNGVLDNFAPTVRADELASR